MHAQRTSDVFLVPFGSLCAVKVVGEPWNATMRNAPGQQWHSWADAFQGLEVLKTSVIGSLYRINYTTE